MKAEGELSKKRQKKSALEKEFQALRLSISAGKMKWRPAGLVLAEKVCVPLQKGADCIFVAILAGHVERRLALVVRLVDVDPLLNHMLDQLGVPVGGQPVQCG